MEELTYKEWFKKNLPPDVAQKAIKNTEIQNDESFLNDTYYKGRYLPSAFTWSATEEGFKFWNEWDEKTKHL